MKLYTPVVVSNDPAVIEAARSRKWKILRQDGQRIWFPTGGGVAPEVEMRIQNKSLEEPAVLGWDSVLRFILSMVHNPMLVIETGSPLSELALWAEKVRGWPHALLVADELPGKNLEGLALTSSARGFFLPKSLTATQLGTSWSGPIVELPDTPLIALSPPAPVPLAVRRDGVTRVLIVAYYAGPCTGVSVQRPNYWFEEMERLSGGRVSVDIAVAVQWPDAPERVHVVPDLGSATVAGRGPLVQWAQNTLELSRANGQSFTQQAALWSHALEGYFDSRSDEFDVVIITGNPFPPFEFARYAKRRWYARTILDYRDPFSMNPRAAFGEVAQAVARHVEIGWNHMADVVTSVNDRCAEWVQADPSIRVEVIRNGYDERLGLPELADERAAGPIRFVHAGQFYGVTPPDTFVQAVTDVGSEFHQVGSGLEVEAVRNHGMLPHSDMVSVLSTMDCGVTFSSELGFETPTKVFDYLAAGLEVLVLYRGDADDSALARMLEGVEGVHWVLDDRPAILEFLEAYGPPPSHRDLERRLKYSRSASTLELVGIIREIDDHSFSIDLTT